VQHDTGDEARAEPIAQRGQVAYRRRHGALAGFDLNGRDPTVRAFDDDVDLFGVSAAVMGEFGRIRCRAGLAQLCQARWCD